MEDFINYKVPSMFLISCYCDFKCCHEQNLDVSICQNEPMAKQLIKEFSIETIYNAFINNDISKAIVIGGLEPMKQFEEFLSLIKYFRDKGCDSDFVLYTGYYKNEIEEQINQLKQYPNIVIKFGRFVPNDTAHYDDILGITLVSSNQYAERIS